jgi:hypothetical protein
VKVGLPSSSSKCETIGWTQPPRKSSCDARVEQLWKRDLDEMLVVRGVAEARQHEIGKLFPKLDRDRLEDKATTGRH